jgi:hypothetical protein
MGSDTSVSLVTCPDRHDFGAGITDLLGPQLMAPLFNLNTKAET